MKLGTFMMPLHPPEKSRTECFEEDIEFVVRADELGYSEAWIGQHHTVAWEPIPANDVFIANVLPRTKSIRLGPGVAIVPQHHPANIAVRMAYLDHLSRGRLNCGFGQGGVTTDWGLFELPDPRTQGLMTLEGIDMILKLWQTDPPFEFKGDFWNIKLETPDPERGIGTLLKPYQKPHPPLAMSMVKEYSMAARTAGQRGYIPMSTNLLRSSKLAPQWQTYCQGAEEAGLPPPDRSTWRISRSIFIGETNEEARRYALDSSFSRAYDYMVQMLKAGQVLDITKNDPEMPDAAVTPEFIVDSGLAIVGDAEECTRQLQELWEETGGFGTLLLISHDWDDKEQWIRTMELLAREVVPRLPTV